MQFAAAAKTKSRWKNQRPSKIVWRSYLMAQEFGDHSVWVAPVLTQWIWFRIL